MSQVFDANEYAQHVRRFARSLICAGRNATDIAGGMHVLVTAAERDLQRFSDVKETDRIACGPGCGACCVLNVAVLFPEVVAIVSYLKKRYTAGQLERLRKRLEELVVNIRWLDDEERLFLRQPCAFLDHAGCCSIHAVRPLLCRAVTSADADACRDAIAMAPLQGLPTIEMNLFQKDFFEAVYCHLVGALEEAGREHRPQRLSSAVLALMSQPALVEQFVAGQELVERPLSESPGSPRS